MSKADSSADVSVIMPAYNSAATIARALASVFAQSVPPDEIIFVDDGSQDGTSDLARGLRPDGHPTALSVLCQANAGAGAARNRGIAEAKGRWIAFLDADDEWAPGKLERSLQVAATGGFNLVGHDMIVADGSSRTKLDCARHAVGPNLYRKLFTRGFMATSTILARRELFDRAGVFNEALRSGQDYELWLRMLALPECRTGIFNEALTIYHVTEGSISSGTQTRLAANMEIIRLHLPRLRAMAPDWFRLALFRIAIIHYEAAVRDWRKGDAAGAIRQVGRMLPAWARMISWAAPNPRGRRP